MIIYIDSEYKCHAADDGTMMAIETEFFDGKCDGFIEGYRFVPEGMSWTRSDGEVFHGEMLSPWKPYIQLEKAQLEYELADMKAALAALEVRVDG